MTPQARTALTLYAVYTALTLLLIFIFSLGGLP
jgi:hypothetical protein